MVPCSTLLREGTFCSGWKLSQRPTNKKKSLSNNFVHLLINGTPSSYVSSERLEIFTENEVEKIKLPKVVRESKERLSF